MNIRIGTDEANQRLDRFMRKYMKPYPQVGLATIFGWIRKGIVKVNDHKKDGDYKVRLGDNIYIHYCEDTAFFLDKKIDNIKPAKRLKFSQQDIKNMIIYEDKNWIWFDKPTDINIHEGNHSFNDTNMNDVLAKYLNFDMSDKSTGSADKSDTFKPSFCFRLDKDTSGILIAAKNYESLKYLNGKIQERDDITKIYICIVAGKLIKQIEINEPLFKGFTDKFGRAKSFVNEEKGLEAKSIATPIANYRSEEFGEISLVAVQIFTGRFHQIRNHLSHVGFPIIGDKLYGDDDLNKILKSKYKVDRQLLHSLYYGFDDINGKYIYKISKYPAEFAKIFEHKYIEKYLERLKNL